MQCKNVSEFKLHFQDICTIEMNGEVSQKETGHGRNFDAVADIFVVEYWHLTPLILFNVIQHPISEMKTDLLNLF